MVTVLLLLIQLLTYSEAQEANQLVQVTSTTATARTLSAVNPPTAKNKPCQDITLQWACKKRGSCEWYVHDAKCYERTVAPTVFKPCTDYTVEWGCLKDKLRCRWQIVAHGTGECVDRSITSSPTSKHSQPTKRPTPKPVTGPPTTKAPHTPTTLAPHTTTQAPASAPSKPCRDYGTHSKCLTNSRCVWSNNKCTSLPSTSSPTHGAPTPRPVTAHPTKPTIRTVTSSPTATQVPCRNMGKGACEHDSRCHWNSGKCTSSSSTNAPTTPIPTVRPSTAGTVKHVPTAVPVTAAPTASCKAYKNAGVCNTTKTCLWKNKKCRPITTSG